MSNQTIKPPIKWVGGKTQLLSEILSKIPGDIPGNYYEPFIGGGAIMINYLSLIKSGEYRLSGKVIASD